MLKEWVQAMADSGGAKSTPKVDAAMFCFTFSSIGALLALGLRAWLVEGGAVVASRTLHRSLLTRVLHAPIAWFDATPMGRVSNRFSHDLQTIDKEVMAGVIRFGDMLLALVGVVVVTVYAVPPLIVAMAIALPLSLRIAYAFLSLSQPLKRHEAAARSPVYSHFAEAVAGIVVIRAYQREPLFLARLHADLDEANRAHLYLWLSNYYMSMRLRLLGAAVAGATALAVTLQAAQGGMDAAVAGLALTYALPFSQAVVFSIRSHAELEMSMNSVTRVLTYLSLSQEEAPSPSSPPPSLPPSPWPTQGAIEVRNLCVRYRPDHPCVLKGLSFSIPPGTKVGVVGRTGSGKSTLLLSLFRLVEAEAGSDILIDGVAIRSLPLAVLRSGLAVIPQEATLFKGTIRSNLDLKNEHTDLSLYRALAAVHLTRGEGGREGGTVQSLEQRVDEGGANFSVGERQLLCFARALLKEAPVVVMDEATASIDLATDAAIQATIRTCLQGTTVLCIAHRLHTVMFYDRVLVLHDGEVAEYDTPSALLRKGEDGLFYRMCQKAGDLEGLSALAREKEEGGW